jgi:DNA-binding SARP family transcriptional activator
MPRSFRFDPPEPLSDLLTRPRLLRALLDRWEHRVTLVVGGAGLGKTTLLVQAVAENRLASRGTDVWLGLEPGDTDADRLARGVTRALEVPPAGAAAEGTRSARNGSDADPLSADPEAIAAAVWQRAPAEVCLVLDDGHVLTEGTDGAAWLAALVDVLPANAHLVLAGRTEPPLPLARLVAKGELLRLGDDDLRFSRDELAGFAKARGVDPEQLDATGGWPAMAEIATRSPGRGGGDYLWEEVLQPLGAERRHLLAVVSDLGGADDALASAATGHTVDLPAALAGIPLVNRDADGWHAPHALWGSVLCGELDPGDRVAIRRRAAAHLTDRGRYDEALGLLHDAGLGDAQPAVLRAACLSSDRIVSSQLGRWLAESPPAVRTSTPGRLAAGLHAFFTTPGEAIGPLRRAVEACQADGDVDGELAAIPPLGRISWYDGDVAAIGELLPRIAELGETGRPRAVAIAALARALVAELAGDDATVIAVVRDIDLDALDPSWALAGCFIAGLAQLGLGDPEAAARIADRGPSAGPGSGYMMAVLLLQVRWHQGRLAEVLDRLPAVVAANRAAGIANDLYMGQVLAAVDHAYAGDVPAARQAVDEARSVALPPLVGPMAPGTALAAAALQLAEGDEAAAAATVREVMSHYGIDAGSVRYHWRHTLALSYVLLPEARSYWDQRPLDGWVATARNLAAAVVALRSDDADPRLQDLDAADLDADVVRASLPHPFAAELAVGLARAGRPEGRALLDALGAPGRDALRRLVADRPGRASRESRAKAARALLAAVPSPPPRPTYLALLGAVELWRDGPGGEEVVASDLRRQRVKALAAYLVLHRRTTRSAVAAALWPDLDDRAAANNLGVTMNHLLGLLEPWRQRGEPSFLVRLDGQSVQLVTGDHLRLDVDDFDHHRAAAAEAAAGGLPSQALDHDRAAVDLYRGDLCLDLEESDWLRLDRELYRTAFVASAVRAGQLLLASGDPAAARDVAHRAVAIDEWSEGAYGVLVGAALAQGQRSTAHRVLQRCLAALTDLGVTPTEPTLQLRRRLDRP